MTCAEFQVELSLYLYGELDFASEEQIEMHLLDCAFCQLALNREKQWHAAVNKQQMDVQPEWLTACRAELKRQLAAQPSGAAQARNWVGGWLSTLFDFRLTAPSYSLAAASFLVLAGFAAGRFFKSSALPLTGPASLLSAGFVQPGATRVQEIRHESGNRIRIVLQQMQVREIAGSRDDNGMREILVGAVRNSDDPGVRIDSVEMLAGQDNDEIKNVLVNTIKTDLNAAVRVKAIESLRQFPSDSVTRNALEYTLAHDRDAGVRAEAMDVLVPAGHDLQVTPQLIQIMSNVLKSAPQTDDYVRGRCAEVLHHQALPNDTY